MASQAFLFKVGAAALLLVSLCLPQSSCTRNEWVGPDGKTVSAVPSGAPPAAYRQVPVTDYSYALGSFDAGDFGSWLMLVTFTWPVPLLAYQWRGRRKGALRAIRFLELPLIAGSAYIIFFPSLGRREIGGYLAMVAVGLYFCAWLPTFWYGRQSGDAPLWGVMQGRGD